MPYPNPNPPAITPASNVVVTITSPATTYAHQGDVKNITGTITGATNTHINWYVNGILNGDINAGIGYFGSTVFPGDYHAPSALAAPGGLPYTATIRAESVEDPTAYDEITVIVYQFISVAVSPNNNPLASPTAQFSAVVTGIVDQTVTWSVAGGGSIDGTGLFTGPPANLTYTVKATAADGTTFGTALVHTQQGA